MPTIKLAPISCVSYKKKDGSIGYKSIFLTSDGDAFYVYTRSELLIGNEYEFRVTVYNGNPTIRICT